MHDVACIFAFAVRICLICHIPERRSHDILYMGFVQIMPSVVKRKKVFKRPLPGQNFVLEF